MIRNKKQSQQKARFFSQERLFMFGTVFFVTAVVLLIGMFLFPRVRSLLHGSAQVAGIARDNATIQDDVPTTLVFNDVQSNQPNGKAIEYLKAQHIVQGYEDGTYKPNDFVTKAELLKFLFEAQKVYPSPAVYRACFEDVHDEWFAPYVCYAQAKGLIQGGHKDHFDPGARVTVLEALKILLLGYNVKLLEASPVTVMNLDPNQWYTKYVWTAYQLKLISWNGAEQDPNELVRLDSDVLATAYLTRGQMAEMFYRLIR